MLTVIVYVSRSGKLPEKCKYFLAYKEELGEVCILECQKKKRVSWKTEDSEALCRRIADRIGNLSEWKLLVIDDRRKSIEKDKLYGDSWFLWEAADALLADKGYPTAVPVSAVVISSVESDWILKPGAETDTVCCKHIKNTKNIIIPRLFIYNFNSNRKQSSEEMKIAFYLAIFYFSGKDIQLEYYRPAVIYKIEAKWDWTAFHQYAVQMEWQHREMESVVEKEIWHLAQPYQQPLYIEPVKTYPSYGKKGIKITAERLKSKENELENIRRGISEKAVEQFEEIRSRGMFNGEYDRSIEETKREQEKYENELDGMYAEGIWNFEEIKQSIAGLKEKMHAQINKKTVGIQIFSVFELVCIFYILCVHQQGWRFVVPVLVIFLAVLSGIFRVVYDFQKGYKDKIREADWNRVVQDIERGERRIKEEISYMANYMKIYHQYYVMEQKEKDRKEELRKVMAHKKKLAGCREVLKRITRLDQDAGKDRMEYMNIEQEMGADSLYYPAGWHKKRNLETPQKEKQSFPFPFIQCIRTDILLKEKTKEGLGKSEVAEAGMGYTDIENTGIHSGDIC